MRPRPFLPFVFALVLAFTSLACTEKPENAPIKVGVFGPFTGGSAPLGISMRKGVQLAVDQINTNGGVMGGRKILIVERDDESNNEFGGPIMLEFIEKEKVVAVLGPVNTGVANAASRYANERKIPMIINVSTGAKVNELFTTFPENYVFHFVANDDVQAEMIVQEAMKKRGYKRPALLCDDTHYGQNGREKLEAALSKHNIKPAFVGKFKIKDKDMTAQLRNAQAAEADVVLAYGIGPELAAITNSMAQIGFKIPLIASWTAAMSNFVNNAALKGEGTMMPQTFIEESPQTVAAKKFVADYRLKFKETPMASAVSAAQGYDSMWVLKMAIDQAGSLESSKLKAALEDLKKPYEGVISTFHPVFTATDHEAIKSKDTQMGIIQNGKVISQK